MADQPPTRLDSPWVGFGLWLVGLVVHSGWAFTIPDPTDWDPAYYRSVARHIVAGDGAVIGALWNLLWIPDRLPYPADIHWMPLPSRILVPGVWLWPAHGDQAVVIMIAATWAPLTWAIAQKLGASPRTALIAGLMAASGLAYARFLSTPDCIALYGAIGGLAVLALAAKESALRTAGLVALSAAASLTRNDGFLLSPCLALSVRSGPAALLVALAGPLTSLLWHLRNREIVGPAYWAARAATSNVVDSENLVGLTTGHVATLTVADRLHFLATEGLGTALIIWLVALPLPGVALWWRKERWLIGPKAYWLLMPFVTQFLAPGVSSSGSVYRSAAMLFPLACACGILVLEPIGAWSQKWRDFHPLFLPVLLSIALLAGSWALIVQLAIGHSPLPPSVCEVVAGVPAGEPVFTVHPLLFEAHCRRPAVVLIEAMTADQTADLSKHFGVHYAVAAPDDDGYAPSPKVADMPRLLPGWVQVGPRLFVDPAVVKPPG